MKKCQHIKANAMRNKNVEVSRGVFYYYGNNGAYVMMRKPCLCGARIIIVVRRENVDNKTKKGFSQ